MKKSLLSLTIAALLSISAMAQETKSHSHDRHLNKLVHEYLQLKNALASDDFELAGKHMNAFAKEVSGNSEMKNHSEHASMHSKHHAAMLAAVESATAANDLNSLRSSFDEVTAELITALKNQGYDAQKLFVQYCPMAAGGDGAQWLSETEEPGNPYFGKKMDTCRSTVEVIE